MGDQGLAASNGKMMRISSKWGPIAVVDTTPAKVENFLMSMVNCRPSHEAVGRLLQKFPEFFPPSLTNMSNSNRAKYRKLLGKDSVQTVAKKLGDENIPAAFVFSITDPLLRVVWGATDPWDAEWKIFWMRMFYNQMAGGPQADLMQSPPPTPFDVAMLYLWQNLQRTRICKNSACQVTPWFFAKKKGQEYCSDTCTLEGQREKKRRWWNAKGSKLRRKRHNESI